jgi:ADP-ribose pyrophosphatase
MARRELLEEIGGTAASIRHIMGFAANAGISNERAEVFLAQGVRLGTPRHEPSEVMEIHSFEVKEVVTMIHRGDIQDGLSALAILLALPYLA